MHTVRHFFHRSWLVGLLTTLLLAGPGQVVLLAAGEGGVAPMRPGRPAASPAAMAPVSAPSTPATAATALQHSDGAPLGAFLPEQTSLPLSLDEEQARGRSADPLPASPRSSRTGATTASPIVPRTERHAPHATSRAATRLALLQVLRC